MSHNRVPILLIASIAIVVMAEGCSASNKYHGSDADRNSLEKTSEAIRAAFARGDIATIMAYHHPDVIKSLSYGNYLIGRDAVQADVAATLQRFHLEWKENQVRSILIQGEAIPPLS
jgi:hypothetical protein